MTIAVAVVLGVILLVLSGIYAGSETGFYALSRYHVEAEAREGRRIPRLILWLLSADTSLLITLLIGNNVVLHGLTVLLDSQLEFEESFEGARELVMTAVLTPVVFFFGELLPKDLYHRRPNLLVGWTAPLVALSRIVFWPLAVPLRVISHGFERALGLKGDSVARALGREAVLEFLEEGARTGSLDSQAQDLLRNALELRSREISREMVPWREVETLSCGVRGEDLEARVASSPYSRLVVLDDEERVAGYVHQLDVLAEMLGRRRESLDGSGDESPPDSEGEIGPHLRPLVFLSPDLSVDRALTRLRIGGHRLAVVGSAEVPLGLISLKDAVETLSGELAVW